MLKKTNILIFLIFISFLKYSFAVEKKTKIKNRLDFIESIGEYKKIKTDDFEILFHKSNKAFSEYFEAKKGFCNGDYSSMIFVENNFQDNVELKQINKKKLSATEKKNCLSEYINDQIIFQKSKLKLQLNYLSKIQKLEIKKLKESNEVIVQNLMNVLTENNKIKKSKKRRKKYSKKLKKK